MFIFFQTVIKSVVKRYIFESQKDESSPIEGEVEELKQDLSSFRFEMLNKVDTQWRSLMDGLEALNARLDGITGQRYGGEFGMKSHHSSHSDLGPSAAARRVAEWKCQAVPLTDIERSIHEKQQQRAPSETDSVINGDQGIMMTVAMYSPPGSNSDSSVVEEEIVPQTVLHETHEPLSRKDSGDSWRGSIRFPKKRPRSQKGRQGSSKYSSPTGASSSYSELSPPSYGDTSSSMYNPKYIKGDLDEFIRVLESSCW